MANPILAAILSFLIPGLGQFYSGSMMKGILFFIIFVILGALHIFVLKSSIYYIISLIYCLYTAYDAYNMANSN